MFTGIIQEMGEIIDLQQAKDVCTLAIACPESWLKKSQLGDSIAVNGVCLTITQLGSSQFHTDLAPSTLQKTALKNLRLKSKVNLEMAMTLESFMGGHLVQGHVNDVAKVEKIEKIDNCTLLSITLPEDLMKYCVPEGSITIDGISLTLSHMEHQTVQMNIIPHTWDKTIISHYKVGQLVNVEVDIIAKYMEKWLSPWMKKLKNGEQSLLGKHD
jgi:riboflavin synthase